MAEDEHIHDWKPAWGYRPEHSNFRVCSGCHDIGWELP